MNLDIEIVRKSMGLKGTADVSIKSAESDLQLINNMTRREFKAEELYIFPIVCCDTRIDRDLERFTKGALESLAALATKGVPVIFDHSWSAVGQTARIYKAEVRQAEDGEYELLSWAYMPRNEKTQSVIDAIDAGILKEVSIGFTAKQFICSICKKDYYRSDCQHQKGREYSGELAYAWIDGVKEWLEESFVAVPAQPNAGVTKSWRQEQEDAKKKRSEGGNEVEKLLEYLKSLNLEVKDDEHALSIVKEWKEKVDATKGVEDELATTKGTLTDAQNKLKSAEDKLQAAPDAAMAAAGQKFFDETRSEIVRLGGILGESTKSLEIIMKGVTDIEALLEVKKDYEQRVDEKFPLTPQTKGAEGKTPVTAPEVNLKEFSI